MTTELNLRFPDANHSIVSFDGTESAANEFVNPLTDEDHRDIGWYVETYGAHSLGDPDDQEAARIAGRLPVLGKALFDAVFRHADAQRLFNGFQDVEGDSRLLTVTAEHPAILALPWELLHDSSLADGTFLFHEHPRISIRRRVPGITAGRRPFAVQAKNRLHLLFVVSRPDGAGFLDPRADAGAVLDALDEHAPGCVTCEFLRPATLDALVARLEDDNRPAVDIVHFDGHGVFDRQGGLPERFEQARATRIAHLEELLRDKRADVTAPAASPPNTGYLLFEQPDGQPDFVAADKLGANLHRHRVGLVILSACQSAAWGDDDADGASEKRPMGCVAARLTATGIPAVLAMTHSVLVATTRTLFGEFYKHLAGHKGLGESLDNARRHLRNNPRKYEVQRGPERKWLSLHDWFLPALYQAGNDVPLLKAASGVSFQLANDITRPSEELENPQTRQAGSLPHACSNVPPAPEAGFFGRRKELWQIERWFAGPTRRITITGFGGQGKTALAQEAGRWLVRAGQFQAAVFVDYARIQSLDAVAVAVSNIGAVLQESLLDAAAAAAALARTPTLVILDNLEALAAEPLTKLLDAAVGWSAADGSRVLCTTRRPEFGHAAYRVEGTLVHRRISLAGLGSRRAPDDALEWFARLSKLPPAPTVQAPKRAELIDLFERVRFHPLSIRVLAQQLKTRTPSELGHRLEQLLAAPNAGRHLADMPDELVASLQLSLDRLDDAARKVLPRLGVFQGGAMEDGLVAITGLGEVDQSGNRAQLAALLAAIEGGQASEVFQAMGLPAGVQLPPEAIAQLTAELRGKLAEMDGAPAEPNLWPDLRRQLEAAALIEAESLVGVSVPYLRFHPTLASLLWAQLDADERARLSLAHRQRYYALANYLYQADRQTPHQAREIAWRELPNLLHAVHAALDAGDPDAVDFADSVNKFLGYFGLKQESEALVAKSHAMAGETGSRAWYLAQSNRGEQLLAAGQVAEAARVFQEVHDKLGEAPSYERAVTLGRLGRCFRFGGRPDLAAEHARQAIAVLDKLEQTDDVKRHRGVCLTDLADALAEAGEFAEARKAYEASLAVKKEIGGERRGEGVVLGQLGTLAMREGRLDEAARRYREALALFQQLREPAGEAVFWHQLGMVFEKSRQWDESERHYREAARIKESQGMIAGANGAATTWNQLAMVSQNAGKPDAAEMWHRKAIGGFRANSERNNLSKALYNLADLLQSEPGRLAEARELAEEGLAIDKTLDPGAAEIWKTYNLLAKITDREAAATADPVCQQQLADQARQHRQAARQAKRNFAGTRYEMQQIMPFVVGVVMTVHQPEHRAELDGLLGQLEQAGANALVAAIRRILDGERDEERLVDGLGLQHAGIIETILHALEDPASLAEFMPG
ncbi:MAG: tetratricopeptide repeat protein [Pirellulaceae bacterium]|nr:tetratricopeptide repeat protein [Pirellulaceae bacterium]